MKGGFWGSWSKEPECLSYHCQPCRQEAHLHVGLARVIEIRGYITWYLGFFIWLVLQVKSNSCCWCFSAGSATLPWFVLKEPVTYKRPFLHQIPEPIADKDAGGSIEKINSLLAHILVRRFQRANSQHVKKRRAYGGTEWIGSKWQMVDGVGEGRRKT